MIRITQCPHCKTLFKVTDDQLKLYNGAVRCGVCQQIFNGANHLQEKQPDLTDSRHFDEEISLPQALPPFADTLSLPAEEETSPSPVPSSVGEEDDITLSLADDDINAPPANAALFDALEEELSAISLELGQVASQLSVSHAPVLPEKEKKHHKVTLPAPPKTRADSSPKKTPEPVLPAKPLTNLSFYTATEEPENTAAAAISDLDDATTVTLSTHTENSKTVPNNPSTDKPSRFAELPDPLMEAIPKAHKDAPANPKAAEALSFPVTEPRFIKKGLQKKQRGLFSTLLLFITTLILLGALAIQGLYLLSDRMIVWWPPSESVIAKACHLLTCPRRLETRISALSIESSELQAIPELKDKYALSMLLRNSSSAYQAWPHIELTLTEPDKKPTVRRVLVPANYLSDTAHLARGIPPYSEESVKLYFKTETASHTDYRISLFYP